MHTLENKALIYDSNCPLCCWYTEKFIQVGALENSGRISFNELNQHQITSLDAHRSRHEIPLIDTKTGKVVYGIDGLTLILSKLFPFFKSILLNENAKKLVKPLYNFISYNRRIIVPSKIANTKTIDCAPDFHFGWRLSLITVCMSFYYLIIFGLKTQFNVFDINLFLVYPILHIAFILFMTKNNWKEKLWNAFGDFSVTNLSTTILFTPLFLIHFFVQNIPAYFMVIVFVLFQFRLMIHYLKRIENKNYFL